MSFSRTDFCSAATGVMPRAEQKRVAVSSKPASAPDISTSETSRRAYGRGFDTSEIAGDSGIGFSFQPEYKIALGRGFSIAPYPLFDYAKVYNRPANLEPDGELVSTGVGRGSPPTISPA